MSCEQVVNKEREGEKGKSPYNSLKEKGKEKEISTFPSPYPSPKSSPFPSPCELHGEGKGKVDIVNQGKREGKGKAVRVDADFILYSQYDPVQTAIIVLRIPQVFTDGAKRYNNARIMRSILRIIGEDAFRQLVYQQWRENGIDGEPRSRAATFMAKLNAAKYAVLKEGGEA